ncbi:MAG: DNA methyltransferase [Plesiomonas shigelloides]
MVVTVPPKMVSGIIRPLQGDVAADFFMGSDSTIKAALKLGRKAIGIELEEETYLKVKEQLQI